MTKKVYLVRHGETTYNVDGLVQDGSSTLTDLGTKQAEQVAQRVQHLDFNELVVSDYERTKQTAQPISRATGKKPIYTPLFREVRRPSEFFHTSRQTPQFKEFLDMEYTNFSNDPSWHYSDEENFEDATARAKEALSFVQSLSGDTLVVSHGHFIRHIVALVATNYDLDGSTWQKMCRSFMAVNTGITTLLYDEATNHWQILTFNDIAHFAE